MTKRTLLLPMILVFIVLNTAACGLIEELVNGESNNSTNDTQQNNNDVENSDNNSSDNKQDNSENNNVDEVVNDDIEPDVTDNNDQASSGPGSKELPDPIEVNEQIQHPNGVIFTLEKISFKEDHVTVDFNAQNGYGNAVRLANDGRARRGREGGITLQDDTGFIYRYVADEGARIKLSDNEEVSGTASFFGRIQDDAQSMTLVFNPDGKEKEKNTSKPKFSFENIKIER